MGSLTKYIFLLMIAFSQSVFGQLSVDPGNTLPISSDNLIQNVFLGSGIEILDIKYFGDPQAVGLFTNAEDAIGINRGIIMTTGYATDATKTSELIANEDTSLDTLDDVDLAGLLVNNIDLIDLAKYEITFIPSSDTLRFRYVFASEEYPDFVCSSTNDVFGFFIDGPNPEGGTYGFKNIALIPDPQDPTMSTFLDFPVSVNYVNSGEPGSFNNASPYCEDPLGSLDFSMYYNAVNINEQPIYNAYLDVFIAEAAVIPCQEYTIKIAIADGRLGDFDSAVFLEEKSFSTNGLLVDLDMPGINGGIAEGCQDGVIRFSLPQPTEVDREIIFSIADTTGVQNPATLNEDFVLSDNSLVMQAGQKFAELRITAIEDFQNEEEEYLSLIIQIDPCSQDTFRIPINDNSIAGLSLVDSLATCAEKAIQIPFNLAEPDVEDEMIFENTSTYMHSLSDSIITAPLTVSNMPEGRLDRSIISEICIQSFSHLRLNDCDFYLEAPNGNLLELSTDNGQRPNNDNQVDQMIQTCFTVFSGTSINLGNPVEGQMDLSNPNYTGLYLPEGNMGNWLFPLTSPINGLYNLIIVDDTRDTEFGTLEGWHIKFRAPYERQIRWIANASFNCTDCADPFVRPSISEYVYLEIDDSYGCSFNDSIWVEAYPVPETPELICVDSLETGLVFSWNNVANADDFEVRINEQFPWFSVSGNQSFLKEGYELTTRSDNSLSIEGLLPNEEISIIIKAISENGCESGRDTLSCIYQACQGTSPVIDSINIDQPICDEEGQVRVDIFAQSQGGALTYRIEYTNITVENTDGIFYQVPQGDWPIRVIDENGCTTQDTLRVNDPTPITINEEITAINCFGDIGAIALQVSGGEGQYSFEWEHGPIVDNIAMLNSGSYTVTVTDEIGCSASEMYNLNEPSPLSFNFIIQDSIGCEGVEEGILELIVEGGTAPYNITWDDGQSGPIYLSNTPGIVSFTVEDSLACSLEGEAELFQSTLFTLQFKNTSDLLCADDQNGSTQVSITGSNNILDVTWDNGETNPQANMLVSGYNTVSVTNTSGCTIVDSVFINAPSPILIQSTITNIGCSVDNDGVIELAVEGGISSNGLYSFNWSNGQADPMIENLDAIEYCVTVTDDIGCENTECFLIDRLEPIDISFEVVEPICALSNSGAIDIDLAGGSGAFEIDWTGPNNFTSNSTDLSDLFEGTYVAHIQDLNFENCDTTISITLNINSNPSASFIVQNDISCPGDSTGSILVEAVGLNDPLEYNWSNNVNTSLDSSAMNLPAGTYIVTILDNFGCEIVDSISISDPTALAVDFQTQSPPCPGGVNGQIQTNPQGGTTPYNYLWSNGDTLANISNLSPGLYSLTLSDINGCSLIDSVILEETTYILNPQFDIRDVSCNSNNDGGIDIILSSDYEPYSFSLDQINYTPNNFFNNLESGIYTLYIIDGNGCESFFPFEILKTESIEIDLIPDITVSFNSSVQLDADIENGNPPYTVNWVSDLASNFSCIDSCLNPIVSNITSSFTATINVVDADGCEGQSSVSIFLKNLYNLYVPEAFSPNNDLINDKLDVYGDNDLEIISFQVFDRGGSKVYESNVIQQNIVDSGWDGQINNTQANTGAYLWLIVALQPDGKEIRFRGQTLLLR